MRMKKYHKTRHLYIEEDLFNSNTRVRLANIKQNLRVFH